jgi:hypothetical protein
VLLTQARKRRAVVVILATARWLFVVVFQQDSNSEFDPKAKEEDRDE